MRNVLGLGLILALASMASAEVIWFDNFDAYADQAAMDAVYTQIYPTVPALLDQAKGYSDGQSVHFGLVTSNSQRRMYKNLGQEVDGTDAQPLKIEFWSDLDTLIWSTRQYIELRGYTGAGYNDGTLQDMIVQGYTSSGVDTTKINGRVLLGPQAGWFSYNTAKSLEWVKLTALIKTNTIEFYVNDQLDSTKQRAPGYTFDCVVIGSGLSSAGADVWFDNLTIEIVPEPGMLSLVLVAGLLIRRR